MLERATVVEVTAEGPLGTPQSTQRASKTLLLVPGQDVLGGGGPARDPRLYGDAPRTDAERSVACRHRTLGAGRCDHNLKVSH